MNFIHKIFGRSNSKKDMTTSKFEDNFTPKIRKIQSLGREEQPLMQCFSQNQKIDKIIDIHFNHNETYQIHTKRGLNYNEVNIKTEEDRIKCLNNYIDNYVMIYADNGTSDNLMLEYQNNFIGAYLTAYNHHGDIILVPDDFWIMIMMYFSKYVTENSEMLRDKFVYHANGSIDLTIIEYADNLEDSLRMEKDWDFFFQEIIKLINVNTKEGIVDKLKCDFTTTDKIYELASTSIIMNSFKKYFSYGRMICSCGINNIKFKGERNDWMKLIDKLISLKEYDVDGKLLVYIQHIEIIFTEFMNAYDNHINLKFWNNIFATEVSRIGSGSQTQTMLEGWFINFFGVYDKVDLDDIPNYEIKVPVKLCNQFTGVTKSLQLQTSFTGVCKEDDYYYRPQLSIILYDTQNIKPANK